MIGFEVFDMHTGEAVPPAALDCCRGLDAGSLLYAITEAGALVVLHTDEWRDVEVITVPQAAGLGLRQRTGRRGGDGL